MAAKGPIDEIIDLGRRLATCRDLVNRESSLDQACREAERRLESLRAQESAAGADLARVHDEAGRILADAKQVAADIGAQAGKDAAAKWNDCVSACERQESESAARAAAAERKAEQFASRCAELEKEEAALGQSVAALRADLAAIKAKLG